jgi:hypothetical protein
MDLAQIIDMFPAQVYVRRGELAIRFSTSARSCQRSGSLELLGFTSKEPLAMLGGIGTRRPVDGLNRLP